jgi:hypothetical protein
MKPIRNSPKYPSAQSNSRGTRELMVAMPDSVRAPARGHHEVGVSMQ